MRPTKYSNLKTEGPAGFFKILRWKLMSKPKPWPKSVINTFQPALPSSVQSHEVFFTFINHATLLIQMEAGTLLTDPIFSDVAGPGGILGPRRVRKPGLSLESLPRIDTVLISHNHYDHLDLPSLKALEKKDQPLFVVPLGNIPLLKRQGIARIVELDWWQKHQLETGLSFSLTPAEHWSKRGLRDTCQTLWGGYLIESGPLKIFFAGDTAYNDHFKEIRKRYGKIDVSLLPIGAYEPRWLMKNVHMNPSDAVQAHLDLESALSLGIHFGTFQLTDEGIDDPVLDLKASLQEGINFIAPEHGQTIFYQKN